MTKRIARNYPVATPSAFNPRTIKSSPPAVRTRESMTALDVVSQNDMSMADAFARPWRTSGLQAWAPVLSKV